MLVDTDVVIWYMRGNQRAWDLLDGAGGFSLSAITYLELVQGMRNKEELRSLKAQLSKWRATILMVNENITSRAMIFIDSYFHSHGIRVADALIGATAVEHAAPLCTANRKHYAMLNAITLQLFRPS